MGRESTSAHFFVRAPRERPKDRTHSHEFTTDRRRVAGACGGATAAVAASLSVLHSNDHAASGAYFIGLGAGVAVAVLTVWMVKRRSAS